MSKLIKEQKLIIKDIVSNSKGLNADEIAFKVIRTVNFNTDYDVLVNYIQKRLDKQPKNLSFEELGIPVIGKKKYVVNVCHVNTGKDIEADLTVVYGNYPRIGSPVRPVTSYPTGEEVYNEDTEEYEEEYETVSGEDVVTTPTGSSFSVNSLEDHELSERSCLLDGIMLALTLAQGRWAAENCLVEFKISTSKFDYGSTENTYNNVSSAINNYKVFNNWEFTLDVSNMTYSDELKLRGLLDMYNN